jgi:hypothetical protein
VEPGPDGGEPSAANAEPDAEPERQPPDRERLLEEVGRYKQPLAAHLGAAQKLVFEGHCLLIYSPPGDTWLADALERKSNRNVLEKALARLCGDGSSWKIVPGEAVEESATASPKADPEGDPSVQHPTVQAVLDIFGGAAETLGSTDGEQEEKR